MIVKVSLVDDESYIRRALIRCLRTENCELSEAADGEEALQKLEQDFFDLMITDNDMPRKTGVELIREITSGQKTVKNPDLAIILLSGRGRPDNLPEVIESMFKPWDEEKIKERIRQIKVKK